MYLSDIKKWLSARDIDTLSAWEIIDVGSTVTDSFPKDEAELQELLFNGLMVAIDTLSDDPTYTNLAAFLVHDVPLLHGIAPYLLPHQGDLLLDRAAESDTPMIPSVVRAIIMAANL